MWRNVCASVVLAAVAGVAVAAPSVRAQEAPPGAWQRLSPEDRARARQNYERFQQLPEKDRERIHERYQRWQNLQPEQRERLRENYESYRGLDPTERERFEQGYRDWKQQRGGPER
jgi:hypothetical protein